MVVSRGSGAIRPVTRSREGSVLGRNWTDLLESSPENSSGGSLGSTLDSQVLVEKEV